MKNKLQTQEILEILKNSSHEEVFKALFVFERAGGNEDLAEKMLNSESLYNLYRYYFFSNDFYGGLIDTEELRRTKKNSRRVKLGQRTLKTRREKCIFLNITKQSLKKQAK